MPVKVVDGDLPREALRAIQDCGRVAVDTETSGLDWAKDSLHLCQLHSDSTGIFLLRNVQDRPTVLSAILEDPTITKVFHFAPFDLRFLMAHWSTRVRNIECTKAASRLLDPALPSSSHSLQALLDRHLGVRIEKGAVRTSDWGAQPLSHDQVRYAASDVEHLLRLADALRSKLIEQGRSDIFSRVCEYMPTAAELDLLGVPNPLNY